MIMLLFFFLLSFTKIRIYKYEQFNEPQPKRSLRSLFFPRRNVQIDELIVFFPPLGVSSGDGRSGTSASNLRTGKCFGKKIQTQIFVAPAAQSCAHPRQHDAAIAISLGLITYFGEIKRNL